MRLICIYCVFTFLLSLVGYAQVSIDTSHLLKDYQVIHIKFQPELSNHPLVLREKVFVREIQDSITVNKLKLYLSDITFSYGKDLDIATKKRFYLMDMEDPESMDLSFTLPSELDLISLNFSLGIDSATQMQGAKGGELDPLNGMYWSWQSGYINFKLEGTANKCPARNNLFQFHIGGFMSPYNTIQKVEIPIGYSADLVVIMDLDQLFTLDNITHNYQIMSPNKKAMTFAGQLPNIFSVLP